MTRRIAHAAQIVAVVLALALVPAALAAKGGGNKPSGGGTSGSSSISAPVMVTDTGTPGISWGDTVTFNVSTTATTTPFVNLLCYQNGVQVASGMKGFWDGSIDVNWNFGLSSPMWKSGAADCVASLTMQTKRGWAQLASTSFHVNA
jgi:hypothetical protein